MADAISTASTPVSFLAVKSKKLPVQIKLSIKKFTTSKTSVFLHYYALAALILSVSDAILVEKKSLATVSMV